MPVPAPVAPPPPTRPGPPLVLVMGVSGAGKSTFGAALAERLEVAFVDADDLHPATNVAKMSAGHPLDDDDRRPWLEAVGEWLHDHRHRGGVVACSALKRAYRDRLRAAAPGLWAAYLRGDAELLARRQAGRQGHFMPPSLLASQLSTLEPLETDEAGVVLDVDHVVDVLVQRCLDLHPHLATRSHDRTAR